MRLRKALFTGFLLPFLWLTGCKDAQPGAEATAYYNVPAAIQEQVEQLRQMQPALHKTVWFQQEKPETHQIVTPDWEQELTPFLDIDLNKKALAGAYTVSEEELPEGRRTVYNLKPEEDARLKHVEVLTNAQNQLLGLRAIQQTSNALFFSREVRELKASSAGTMAQYRISGVQKIVLFDSLRYATQGALTK
ncbi:MAG TPA: hypothetical protein VK927_03690 [Adhaeribacter sp.]|nr:hypothetical protein [Adhaeribacter sp.]